VLNAMITVALVGGPQEMKEVLEPNWQVAQEWPPPGVQFVAGKTVLVTGANRGYGLAISQHLVGFGAKVSEPPAAAPPPHPRGAVYRRWSSGIWFLYCHYSSGTRASCCYYSPS